MEHVQDLHKHNNVLRSLNSLPRKMIGMHGKEANLPAFLLHSFCHDHHFNLDKAAYFVDSPDFDFFKGVAGVSRQEDGYLKNGADIWENIDEYNNYLNASPFNKNVRNMTRSSVKAANGAEKDIIGSVAQELLFKNPEYYAWNMKHDNHAYFIFDRSNGDDKELDEHLEHSLYLLSFCPVH